MKKLTKFQKTSFAFFSMLFTSSAMFGIAGAAVHPKNLTPEVQELIVKKTWFGESLQKIQYQILRWLARIVDYIDEAVNQVIDFNLYSLIKGVFNIDNVIYPIAWALAAISVVLCAVLLITKADKSHITDTARGILVSVFFIIALPSLVSSFEDLKTTGVSYAKDTTTQDSATNRTLGEYILASNIFNVNNSITKNEPRKQSQQSSFKSNPASVYSLNICSGLDRGKTNYVTVTTAAHNDLTPKYTFDDLTFEHKLELLDIVDDYSYWQARNDWYLSLSDEKKEKIAPYMVNIWSDGNKRSYYFVTQEAPDFHLSYEYYILCKAVENAGHTLQDRGVDISASQLSKMLIYCQKADTFEEAVNRLSKGDFAKLDFYEYKLSAMQILNVSNADDFTKNKMEFYKGGSYETFKDSADFAGGDLTDQIDKLWQLIRVGHLTETNFFYRIDFLWGLFMLVITAVCLIFAGIKLASLLYDILFAQVIAPLVAATDMYNSGRGKKAIMNLLSCYLAMIIVVLDLRLYILILTKIQDSGALSNPIAVIFITVAGCKFVIDGPDLLVQLLGIDAGVKSGVSTIMGIRSASQVVRGAGHVAGKAVGLAGGAVGGAVGGAIGGAVGGAHTAVSSSHSDSRTANTVKGAFGAVGGALAGAAAGGADGAVKGARSGAVGGAVSGTHSGVSAAERVNSGIRKPHNDSAGSSNNNNNNNSGSNTMNDPTGKIKGRDGKDGMNGTNGEKGRDGESVKGEQGDKGDRGDSGANGYQESFNSGANSVPAGSFGAESRSAQPAQANNANADSSGYAPYDSGYGVYDNNDFDSGTSGGETSYGGDSTSSTNTESRTDSSVSDVSSEHTASTVVSTGSFASSSQAANTPSHTSTYNDQTYNTAPVSVQDTAASSSGAVNTANGSAPVPKPTYAQSEYRSERSYETFSEIQLKQERSTKNALQQEEAQNRKTNDRKAGE